MRGPRPLPLTSLLSLVVVLVVLVEILVVEVRAATESLLLNR
jgi:hypothetical protein